MAHHPFGEGRDRHRCIQQMDVVGRVEHGILHLAVDRRAVDKHAAGDPQQAQRHRPRYGAVGLFDLRCHRRHQFATDEHKHRHADIAEQAVDIANVQRRAEPAGKMSHRRHKNAAQAENGQRGPHAEGQHHFDLAEDFHADGVEQAENHHHADAHHPGILVSGHLGVNRLEVHQRHNARQDRLRRPGEDMDDQIGAQRAGDSEEAAHAAGDIVVHRTGGGNERRRLGKGGDLRLHHNKGQQHRQREGIAAHAEAAGDRQDHRAGHDQPDGAGEGGREADDAALKMAGESVTKHSQPLHNNGVGQGIASATPG
ncbi:hypothetical protein UUU_09600 [Klebsiella pneumoniae subsp. pneumoniae DSM 30104 = JCM 1662 = NBRC 14940]|nr:hypothetical protein UUU_09600 [Klebsiella pneumoniae subsp. pneumoniae DSM 30104 = JCM 1662 = NBRC 14940]